MTKILHNNRFHLHLFLFIFTYYFIVLFFLVVFLHLAMSTLVYLYLCLIDGDYQLHWWFRVGNENGEKNNAIIEFHAERRKRLEILVKNWCACLHIIFSAVLSSFLENYYGKFVKWPVKTKIYAQFPTHRNSECNFSSFDPKGVNWKKKYIIIIKPIDSSSFYLLQSLKYKKTTKFIKQPTQIHIHTHTRKT